MVLFVLSLVVVAVLVSDWAGNNYGYRWESNKSLMTYKLIERVSHKSFATGFRGPVDQIKLTDGGRRFIPKMLEQFSAEDAAEPELRTFSSGFDPFSEFGGIPASSPSGAMQEDEAELHAWVGNRSTWCREGVQRQQ